MKVAWGITGSGDLLPETVKIMKGVIQENRELKLYVFLSKAAILVLKWYGLSRYLREITEKIFLEVDSNRTKPFYYLPGALQLKKFSSLIVCPATANTVAKIVNGIADTLITNAVAQAAKANVPVYILPVDHKEGKQITVLPSGEKLELEMREVDVYNAHKLSKMRNIRVFNNPTDLGRIFKEVRENVPF